MKSIIAITLAIIFGALGDILLSHGMRSNGEVSIRHPSDLLKALKLAFTHPVVLLGITSMAVYFGSYLASLAWMDVSIADPLTAMSYVIATGYAVVGMRERVRTARWAGVLLITMGSVFIGMSSQVR